MGIHAIALYGNYMLVVNSMTRVVDQIFDAVVAPLGNLGVTESGERQYQVFKTCFFVNAFIAAFISIPMLCLFNPVITQIWLGPDYAFPEIVVVLIVLLFYLKEMRCAAPRLRARMACIGIRDGRRLSRRSSCFRCRFCSF